LPARSSRESGVSDILVEVEHPMRAAFKALHLTAAFGVRR
jgi:hypothetical protein